MRSLVLTLSFLAVAACAPEPSEVAPEPEPDRRESAGVDFNDEAPPGEEQIVITTRDGDGDLGLTDEVLFFRLSDRARARVESDMAQETEDLDGLAGSIARSVTGAVADALDFTVRVPIEEVTSVRYEDGQLQIETEGDTSFSFDDDGTPGGDGAANENALDRQFEPDDARRFVETFERVKAGR